MTLRYSLFLAFAGLALTTERSFSQDGDAFDPKAVAARVAPFLDEQTAAFGRLNVEKLDVAAAAKALADVVASHEPELRKQMETDTAVVAKIQKDFQLAGGREAFVFLSLNRLPPDPFAIFPAAKEGGAKMLADFLRAVPPVAQMLQITEGKVVCELYDDSTVFLGDKETLDRLSKRRGAAAEPSEALVAALTAAGDCTFAQILLPTKDQRRVIAEAMPSLPPELGGGSTEAFTQGLSWIAVSLQSPPDLSIRIVVEARDEKAAEQQEVAFGKALDLAAAHLKEHMPDAAKLTEIIRPTRDGRRLVMELNEKNKGVPTLVAALKPSLANVRGSARRQQSMNNLHQLALGIHSFIERDGALPSVASVGKDGKPLLSWRVHLLPYVEQDALYKQFKLDEPWDSEHNRKLIDKMPAVFRSPSSKTDKAKGLTVYLAPVGKDLIFTGEAGAGVKLSDIRDGTSNTIMLVEAADEAAVVWTSPHDWTFDAETPLRNLVGQHDKLFLVAFADGSAHAVNEKIMPEVFIKLLTRNGGEVATLPSP